MAPAAHTRSGSRTSICGNHPSTVGIADRPPGLNGIAGDVCGNTAALHGHNSQGAHTAYPFGSYRRRELPLLATPPSNHPFPAALPAAAAACELTAPWP